MKPIVFDREARIAFVTGFKKRKNERRLYAANTAAEEKKDEKKEMKRTKAIQRKTIEE